MRRETLKRELRVSRTRLLVVSAALAAMGVFAGSLSAAAGDLDPTFDADGKVVTDIGTTDDRAYDVALQRDGKIVVVGEAFAGAWNFVLARYNRSGSLDGSFGAGGIVRTEFGWGVGVAIQPDGKIVVVGAGRLPGSPGAADFAVARYNADGTLDATFGVGGKAAADFGFSDFASDVAIQQDGKIVVAGSARRERFIGTEAFGLARFNPDGSLDFSFDGDGRVMTAFTSFSDGGSALELQRDGKVVVSGYAGFDQGGQSSATGAMARYNPDGSLDGTFDGDGRLTTADVATSELALQTDGKILVAGGGILRLNPDGTRDTGFGRGGVVAIDCMWAGPVLVQPDRKIIVAGGTRKAPDFTVLRLHPDGRVDAGFRGGDCEGVDLGSGSSDVPTAAVLQTDRRIVVAGWTQLPGSQNHDFAVARYLNPAPCVVPNVRGRALATARLRLARAHCAVGKVTRKYSAQVSKGRVIAQSPRAGATLPAAGKVRLVVSRGLRR